MSLIRLVAVALFFVTSPLLTAQSATAPSTDELIQKIETCLPPAVVVKGEPPTCTPLLTRMQQLHVQGVSIAVVHHGVIEWARGYGIATPDNKPVTPDTIFQAGSISKPVASMAALHLVQQGKLSLDADVNTKLTSWKVPASDAAPGAVVTLRELMTHTAGMTVHGFPGYAAGEPVPTLVQVLNGEKPANTPPVRIETPPGTKWNYSGGGITIMQQLMIDVSHEPFPKLMHDTVLAPIGMKHSTYEQPLPAALLPTAATPYDGHDKPIPGGAHTYPEMAAAGLWTTPSDLGRFIIENQRSLKGDANHVLSQPMTKGMMTPGKNSWGLGIALAYGWPDFHPIERTMIQLPPEALTRFAGTYQIANLHVTISITVENGKLMAQVNNQPKEPIFPESATRFFNRESPVEFEFFPNDKGEITSLIAYQGPQQFKADKKP